MNAYGPSVVVDPRGLADRFRRVAAVACGEANWCFRPSPAIGRTRKQTVSERSRSAL